MLWNVMSNVGRWAGYLVTIVVAVTVAALGLSYFQEKLPQSAIVLTKPADDLPPQTEEAFLNGLSSIPEKSSEWWAARADHRLLAQVIFSCQEDQSFQISSVPRQYYRSLLLDLTPTGDHAFAASTSDAAKFGVIEKSAKPLVLDDASLTLLALSDSIARARITAADGASVNVPWVQRLGIATVVISALATLFVTLQGRMRPVEMDDTKRKEFEQSPLPHRVVHSLAGPGSGFRWVAFFAIALSITGTSLAGLKQVYDPTRTLTQNTRSLLELRQLHQEVIFGAKCKDKPLDNQMMVKWIATLYRLRGAVLPEYGAYAALDLSGGQKNEEREGPTKAPTADRTATPAAGAKQTP